jgi:hypothetical protein
MSDKVHCFHCDKKNHGLYARVDVYKEQKFYSCLSCQGRRHMKLPNCEKCGTTLVINENLVDYDCERCKRVLNTSPR